MRIVFLCLLSVFGTSNFAQTDRVKYIKKVQELCPNADIIEYELKTDFVEIEYICDDEVYEVAIGNDLTILYTEIEAEIPTVIMGIIQKKLNKNFTGWILDEQALVTANDTSYYRLEVLVEGIEQNVYFSLEGKNFKTKGIVSNEAWNSINLVNSPSYHKSKYNFLKPQETYELPDILNEISGISRVNDSIFVCVQDELGIVFYYNLNSNEIQNMIRFTDIGDFEDLVFVDKEIFVLRSDGAIFRFNPSIFKGTITPKMLAIQSLNVEGLFYDKFSNRFLVACKDVAVGGNSNERYIYSFDKDHTNLKVEQVINTDEISTLIQVNYPDITVPYLQFNPSAIAINPINKQVYVLSATNRVLVVYDKGKLIETYLLPAELYYKPEGIVFDEKGTLFISSEGSKNGSVGGQIIRLNMN